MTAPTATATNTMKPTTTIPSPPPQRCQFEVTKSKTNSSLVKNPHPNVCVCDMSFYEGHTHAELSLYFIPPFTLGYAPVGIRIFCKHCSILTHTNTNISKYVQKCVLTSKNGEWIGFTHSIHYFIMLEFRENIINFLCSFLSPTYSYIWFWLVCACVNSFW